MTNAKKFRAVILAAGQGTRLRPLTETRPKCLVPINGKSIIDRQLAVMNECGIDDEQIVIICGYLNSVLREHLKGRPLSFVENKEFETTNMVYSLLCARDVLTGLDEVVISYGDIVYKPEILKKIMAADAPLSVVVDDGWQNYWSKRFADPLSDAETLRIDGADCLTEIGQKTDDITKIQAQYIGLMRFQDVGLKAVLSLADEARRRSANGEKLWRTERNYAKMYMTDLLTGLIDTGEKLKAVHIRRGWYEVDDMHDLSIAEAEIDL